MSRLVDTDRRRECAVGTSRERDDATVEGVAFYRIGQERRDARATDRHSADLARGGRHGCPGVPRVGPRHGLRHDPSQIAGADTRLLDLRVCDLGLQEQRAIDAWRGDELDWVRTTLRFLASEARELRAGGETVITRLAGLLVIQAVRRWLAQHGDRQQGWLGALRVA